MGTYTAAITRKIKTKKIKESISYEFFGDGEKSETKEYTSNKEEIEWFHLKVEKEGENCYFPNMEARLEELKCKKESKVSTAYIGTCPSTLRVRSYEDSSTTINKNNNKKGLENIQEGLPFKEISTIPYDSVSINSKIINSLVRQLITCSLIIPNESTIDINKWAMNMSSLYERRFGKGDIGIKRFQEWADTYTEYLTWNVIDEELLSMGFDSTDIQSICAYNLIQALDDLPKNKYIDLYIRELEKYIIYE